MSGRQDTLFDEEALEIVALRSSWGELNSSFDEGSGFDSRSSGTRTPGRSNRPTLRHPLPLRSLLRNCYLDTPLHRCLPLLPQKTQIGLRSVKLQTCFGFVWDRSERVLSDHALGCSTSKEDSSFWPPTAYYCFPPD